jgi:REP element-mobilizing transposase RayT
VVYNLHAHPPAGALPTKSRTIQAREQPQRRHRTTTATGIPHPTHVRKYLWGGHFWSGSYFAGSCGRAPLTIVKQYIESQQHPV